MPQEFPEREPVSYISNGAALCFCTLHIVVSATSGIIQSHSISSRRFAPAFEFNSYTRPRPVRVSVRRYHTRRVICTRDARKTSTASIGAQQVRVVYHNSTIKSRANTCIRVQNRVVSPFLPNPPKSPVFFNYILL